VDGDRNPLRLGVGQGQPVEAFLQDRADASVGGRTDNEGAGAGGL